jgi:hypothetical protein
VLFRELRSTAARSRLSWYGLAGGGATSSRRSLAGRAVKETEARCSVLAQFIDDCDRAVSRTSAWSEALRELDALHGYRRGLLRRRSLIQQALECSVGESPAKGPLSQLPNRTVLRTQQQVQVRARRRRS